ncbi:MAG: RnfABCDGE type electron transport complex subunit D [SAR324 cluster bacterium]|nr:RnfABCDGE type electron transport complex subunit D [SAR324 cluster bacterium]
MDLDLSTAPHVERGVTVEQIMLNVVYALVPIVLFAVAKYGLSALTVVLTTTISCVLFEQMFWRLISKDKDEPSPVKDYSATITGLLLGLTLPPGFPLWMAVVGSFVAMSAGKWAFGGLGSNPFNPALVGRIFLQATFPVSIATWNNAWADGRFTSFLPTTLTAPFMKPVVVDAVTGATPLGMMKFENIFTDFMPLFLGSTHSSIGEVSPLLLLACGVYLGVRKMLDWRIPTGILLSVFIMSTIFYSYDSVRYPYPFFMLMSGGLMLGAIFMATDMVSSPLTPIGVWLYAILIGVLIVIIRFWGGLPEGVQYAIILGNAVFPLLDRVARTRVYGTKNV